MENLDIEKIKEIEEASGIILIADENGMISDDIKNLISSLKKFSENKYMIEELLANVDILLYWNFTDMDDILADNLTDFIEDILSLFLGEYKDYMNDVQDGENYFTSIITNTVEEESSKNVLVSNILALLFYLKYINMRVKIEADIEKSNK
jgi:hypothetical protein|nr:MAG TPA: hypothetical protein [Caudoviricetes sp.]DAX90124.1 MAG TPA: hypothetical protein [Caudoviricetes sp.]